MPGFLDVHSHVIPSGDDGVTSIAEGLALCREAARRGTDVLYGTPHVWPVERLSPERDAAVREAHAVMAPVALEYGLELRLGFELTPSVALLDEDLTRYVLQDIEIPSVLVEFPFTGDVDLTLAVAEHAEELGMRPIMAHPERAEAILADPARLERFVGRGWPIQLNSSSLTGYHGAASYELGWWLAERRLVDLVGSDGHRAARPPFLDTAFATAMERLGNAAGRLFDGSALTGSAGRDTVHLAQRR